jgi:hypothetical protein
MFTYETLTIGSTPSNETCAQVGSANYATLAKIECARFKAQILRHYPEPDNGYLKTKSFAHDFGSYFEVCAVFDPEDETATRWAYSIESDEKNVLQAWDDHFMQPIKKGILRDAIEKNPHLYTKT